MWKGVSRIPRAGSRPGRRAAHQRRPVRLLVRLPSRHSPRAAFRCSPGSPRWPDDAGGDDRRKSRPLGRHLLGARAGDPVRSRGAPDSRWPAARRWRFTATGSPRPAGAAGCSIGVFRHPVDQRRSTGCSIPMSASGWWTDSPDTLADSTRDPAVLDAGRGPPARLGRERLARAAPEVTLLVMGHTHRPAVAEVAPGRWYLNPGAWMDGFCYATADRRQRSSSGASEGNHLGAGQPLSQKPRPDQSRTRRVVAHREAMGHRRPRTAVRGLEPPLASSRRERRARSPRRCRSA